MKEKIVFLKKICRSSTVFNHELVFMRNGPDFKSSHNHCKGERKNEKK